MKRCRHCGKIVWPWQRQYLGLTPAHEHCDVIAFVDSLNELVLSGDMTSKHADKMLKARRKQAYS